MENAIKSDKSKHLWDQYRLNSINTKGIGMEQGKSAQSKSPHLHMGFAERRKYPRFECELPIDCITSESEIHVGIAANISTGGMSICLHDRIKVGTPLRIQLVFAHDFQLKTIGANAIVVWSNVVHHVFWGRYRYGLRLIGMSERAFPDFKGLLGLLAREFRQKNAFPSS